MLNSAHARHKAPARRTRVLMRTGLLTTALGVALGTGGPIAMAAEGSKAPRSGGDTAANAVSKGLAAPVRETTRGTGVALGRTLETVNDLQLNPLANTGTDPLDNSVGTQIADFKPVSTAALTGPLARGASLGELPLVGPVTSTLTEALPG
ncbi:hypothetical protein ABZ820_32790 [Streptomyces diacarni]|uniref:Uncharacterized protein n=1 Tax=Streptomyces diacarni TaxID=2800381 RepID=A0A367EPK6_9ACTN|nr:hypothetical protein [Streptomyces diacarni]RCG19642.1 hypothetical protein DTL70_23195 [Streptomyces diacarni]